MGFVPLIFLKSRAKLFEQKFGKEMNGWPLLKWRSCLLSFWPKAKPFLLMESFWVLHREQGVPLKGPFLALFSQGILSKVNENAHFGHFRIFFGACFVWPF